MRYLYLFFISVLSFSFSFSQGFAVSPSHSVSTTIQTNEYVTSQISFTNTTTDSLSLSWNLLEKVTPTGWDYSYCDYNSCYDATKIEGTMAPIPPGGNGFIKANVMTTVESWSYFKFSVFNVSMPELADTIEFWFNGIADIKENLKETISIYPNPIESGDSWTIKNLPVNSTIEIFNSLGQKIGKTIQASNNLILDGNLTKGVYILKIHHNKLAETRKLIVR
jgi:hypothetical protein